MILKVISPEKTLFSGEVEKVKLPGMLGGFTVLERHAPLISSLVPGDIVYAVQGEEAKIAVQGGIVEVRDNKVIVCLK